MMMQPRPMMYNAAPPSVWSTHTAPDGRNYYYNSVTRQSTYEKPEALMTEAEKKLVCNWAMHHTQDGKPYYSHKVTRQSVWEEPEEYKNMREAKALLEASSKSSTSSNNVERRAPVKKQKVAEEKPKKKKDKIPLYETLSPEEARTQFFKLLESKKVTSETRWKDIESKIAKDARYYAFRKKGQRKQAFAEYCGQRRKIEREERRLGQRRARKEFMKLLMETKKITSRTWCSIPFYHSL
jgi:pre-mRNA-processing factor 40